MEEEFVMTTFDEITLERLRLGKRVVISDDLLSQPIDLALFRDIYQTSTFELRTWVWADREHLRHEEVRYPADWWQAIKERFAPRWFKGYWPVLYKIVSLDARVLYPEMKRRIPGETYRIAIMREDSSDLRPNHDS